MGADAVSMHVNIGAESEAKMLQDLGMVAVECMEWGMPLLAMMYPRGKNIATSNDLEQVKLAARVAAELGADIVKTVYTGDPESFREVTRGCPVPVVVAGGSKTDDRTTLELIEGAMAGRCGRHLDWPERIPAQAPGTVRTGSGLYRAREQECGRSTGDTEGVIHDWKGHQDRTDNRQEHGEGRHRTDGPRVLDGTD